MSDRLFPVSFTWLSLTVNIVSCGESTTQHIGNVSKTLKAIGGKAGLPEFFIVSVELVGFARIRIN